MARLIEALEKQGTDTQGTAAGHTRVPAEPCPLQSAPRASPEPELCPAPWGGWERGVPGPSRLPRVGRGEVGSALTPLSRCVPGIDSEVLYRPGPAVLGDAELKQALLAGESPGGKGAVG